MPIGQVEPASSGSGVSVAYGKSSFALPVLLATTALGSFFGAYQLFEHYVLAPRVDDHSLHLLHIIRGITGALILSALTVLYMMRYQASALGTEENADRIVDREQRRRQHLTWFIQMRWIASAFTLALIAIAVPMTEILSAATLPFLLGWWLLLVAANLAFTWLLHRDVHFERQMVAQVIVDLVILSGFLNASGGIENPLHIAYLFHVIIAGILLTKSRVLALTGVAAVLFSGVAFGEYARILPHFTILLFPHHGPLQIEHHASHDLIFVAGRAVPFVAVLFLTAYFTTLVSERLRRSESDLETLARRAMLDRGRLESVIDSAGLGIVVLSRDLTIDWYNARAAAALRWSSTAVGASCPHQHDSACCVACIAEETIRTGTARDEERTGVTRHGGVAYFRIATSPVRTGPAELAQIVVLIEDITERKALESEALHRGKLSILGHMAAGIAHEIGNPLSSLDARLHLMELRKEDHAFVGESFQVLRGQIDRIRRIVRGVSHFSAKRSERWGQWSVNPVIDEAVRLIRLDRRAAAVEFRVSLAPSPPPVSGVRDQMLQVVINLLLNAVEAMPRGGVVDVRTFVDDSMAAISVRDAGIGMDDAIRNRLFEPFFTTKREGTGLGLSICYSLVHAHGGTISAASIPGEGSEFVVRLPFAVATDERSRWEEPTAVNG